MGLRINTNFPAVTAGRNLRNTDRELSTSLQRLSTGLRINQASDDPSGLIISEKLRAQIKSLDQALNNTENASNLIGTTEAALAEINNLLVGMRESGIFALNTGGSSPAQIQAEQDSVDAAISAIDRIASTTRYGNLQLLDGSQHILPISQSAALSDINVRMMQFDGFPSRTVTVNVINAATRASNDVTVNVTTTVVTGGNVTFRIAGNRGTQTVTLGSGVTGSDLMAAVNLLSLNTGVFMSSDAASNVYLKAIDYGDSAFSTLQVVGGSGLYAGAEFIQVAGTDVIATVNGVSANGDGRHLSLTTSALNVELDTDPLSGAGAYTFNVRKSGLRFQLLDQATPYDSLNISIQSIAPAFLGAEEQLVNIGSGSTMTIGGVLSTIMAGGKNDLFKDPGNATRIIDAAIDDVSKLRAYLGATKHDLMDPNLRSLGVALENLTKSESAIRDLDFAAETAEFTRTQVLYQSGISVLASANQLPQAVLQLLQ